MLAQTHHQTVTAPSHASPVARLVGWLLDADARFRAQEQLRQMSPEQRADIGLARRDGADTLPHDPRLGW